MDVLFLDANVIFSAAYTPESRLRLLWDVPDAEMVTSEYAADEALRNLPQPEQRADMRLERQEERRRLRRLAEPGGQ